MTDSERLAAIEAAIADDIAFLDVLAERADRYGDNASYEACRDTVYRDIGMKVADILRHDSV